ncbi:MAG: DUF4271 domain-containing protein [Bacteroidetes bacterium]|nr:DUF4271 domain-containing protein [Bacteroidota bacterium]
MRKYILLIVGLFLSFLSAKAVSKDSITTIDSIEKSHIWFDRVNSKYFLKATIDSAFTQKGISKPRYRNLPYPFPTYYFYLLSGLLVSFTISIFRNSQYILQMVRAFSDENLLNTLFRDGKFGFGFMSLLFDCIFLVSASIFIQLVFFKQNEEWYPWILIFTICIYYLKLLLIQIIAYVFHPKENGMFHSLSYLLFFRIAGVLLFPLLFLSIFQITFPIQEILHYFFIAFVALYSLWTIQLLLRMGLNGFPRFVYIFIYLCALELSPVLILLKNISIA